MKILFVGGCILISKSVAKESLFHNVLLKKHPQLTNYSAFYVEYFQLTSVLENKIRQYNPDVVVLFVRPFPFLILNRFLIKTLRSEKKTKRKFHPALFGNNDFENIVEWANHYSGDTFPLPAGEAIVRNSLGYLNLAAGLVAGLNKWACTYVEHQILAAQKICFENNSNLVVVGPQFARNNFIENKIYKNLNQSIADLATKNKIEFTDIFNSGSFSEKMFATDKFHFNEEGHKQLAIEIEKTIFR